MYDVNFFKESFKIKKKIVSKEFSEADYNLIENELENIRAKSPHIFNIETTNYCNMTCIMCPVQFIWREKISGLMTICFKNCI